MKETTAGSADATVKYECGARLTRPRASTVVTQAIGRGATRQLSIAYALRPSSSTGSSVRGAAAPPGSLTGA